ARHGRIRLGPGDDRLGISSLQSGLERLGRLPLGVLAGVDGPELSEAVRVVLARSVGRSSSSYGTGRDGGFALGGFAPRSGTRYTEIAVRHADLPLYVPSDVISMAGALRFGLLSRSNARRIGVPFTPFVERKASRNPNPEARAYQLVRLWASSEGCHHCV